MGIKENVLFEQDFKVSDVPKLAIARQNFKVIDYYGGDSVFQILENNSKVKGSDEFLMRILKSKDDSKNIIDLGSHPSLDGAKKFFENQFLKEDAGLINSVRKKSGRD
jgi:hypothetical protein